MMLRDRVALAAAGVFAVTVFAVVAAAATQWGWMP